MTKLPEVTWRPMYPSMPKPVFSEHDAIYLEPECQDCIGEYRREEGRLWCQDPQEPCEKCGKEWVRFERAK